MFFIRKIFNAFVFPLFLLFALFAPGAFAAEPQLLIRSGSLVGTETVLAADPASIPTDATIEWAISGDVKPVRLRAGGRECVFTPADTSPITVTAFVHDRNGAELGSAELTVTPREFDIDVSVIADDPVVLWDPLEKAGVSADTLITGRPIRLRARLDPPFKGAAGFAWTVDASTALLSADSGSEILISRSEIGDSEISVSAFNSAGNRLGGGSNVISVTLPRSLFEESEKSHRAWEDWQRAQKLWEEKNYADAVKLGEAAHAAAPRDLDIANGYRAMSTNYTRFTRALAFRQKAEDQIKTGKLDDALKSFRLAQAVWPTDEGEKSISETENLVNELRIRRQKAEWLRDTASAYDQEGLYEEAIEYYGQSAAVLSSDAIEDRMARIRQRLELMSDANRYAGEGSALEKEGNIEAAIDHYTASIVSNPDAALKQHIEELHGVAERRQRQARALCQEGQALVKQGKASEALHRFRESLKMWETPEAQQRVSELEKTARSNAPLRDPEDFGIGTRVDAARLTRSADTLYLQRRFDEAAQLYRKSLAIFPNDELKALLEHVEGILRDRKAAQAANAKVRQANALFKSGKVSEAMDLYRESLALHPNAEVQSFLTRNGEPLVSADTAPAAPARSRGRSR